MLAGTELFSATSILSVGAATAAVNVATRTLRKVFSWSETRIAFAAALVLAYLAVAIQGAPKWYDWILAFFNACLLFCSALGLNELGVNAQSRPGQGAATGRPFFTSWLH